MIMLVLLTLRPLFAGKNALIHYMKEFSTVCRGNINDRLKPLLREKEAKPMSKLKIRDTEYTQPNLPKLLHLL